MRTPILILSGLLLSGALHAADLTIACAKGYKKPFTTLIQRFEKEEKVSVEAFYGNMRQVISQARLSGKVSMIIGDKTFLQKSGYELKEALAIGQGKLVLAWPKGRQLERIDAITQPDVKRVAMPEPKKAIYGKAAQAYMKKTGIDTKVADKLLIVATVPQVSTYLVANEVDAGFINLTDALAIKDKIGGWIEADTALYPEIKIVGMMVKDAPDAAMAKKFAAFLESDESRKLLQGYGL